MKKVAVSVFVFACLLLSGLFLAELNTCSTAAFLFYKGVVTTGSCEQGIQPSRLLSPLERTSSTVTGWKTPARDHFHLYRHHYRRQAGIGSRRGSDVCGYVCSWSIEFFHQNSFHHRPHGKHSHHRTRLDRFSYYGHFWGNGKCPAGLCGSSFQRMGSGAVHAADRLHLHLHPAQTQGLVLRHRIK